MRVTGFKSLKIWTSGGFLWTHDEPSGSMVDLCFLLEDLPVPAFQQMS